MAPNATALFLQAKQHRRGLHAVQATPRTGWKPTCCTLGCRAIGGRCSGSSGGTWSTSTAASASNRSCEDGTLPEPQITRYQRFLRDTQGLRFDTYDALWRWSVSDLEAFWRSIWQFFDLQSPTPYARVLGDERMPGARWFDGAQVNYAQQVLRHVDALQAAGHPAILFADEPMLAQGRVDDAVMGRSAPPGGGLRSGASAPRREPRRSCVRVPAEPARDRGGVPRLRQPGCDLVDLLARHGPGRRARPLSADRAEGAGRLRRLPLRRRRARPARRGARADRAAAERGAPGVAAIAGRGR